MAGKSVFLGPAFIDAIAKLDEYVGLGDTPADRWQKDPNSLALKVLLNQQASLMDRMQTTPDLFSAESKALVATTRIEETMAEVRDWAINHDKQTLENDSEQLSSKC